VFAVTSVGVNVEIIMQTGTILPKVYMCRLKSSVWRQALEMLLSFALSHKAWFSQYTYEHCTVILICQASGVKSHTRLER